MINTNETITINMTEFAELIAAKIKGDDNTKIKTHGKFDGQIIQGEVYNPYTCRRFLPAQFMKLMKMSSQSGKSINEVIRNSYTNRYVIDYTNKQLEKLIYLKNHDKIAFNERFNFFNPRAIWNIYYQIAKDTECNHIIEKLNNISYYSSNYDNLLTIGKMVMIEFRTNYEFRKKFKVPNQFIECFKKAGAYYTLKNFIMFKENFKFVWYDMEFSGREAMEQLRLHIDSESYILYKALKLSMERSDISENYDLKRMN